MDIMLAFIQIWHVVAFNEFKLNYAFALRPAAQHSVHIYGACVYKRVILTNKKVNRNLIL